MLCTSFLFKIVDGDDSKYFSSQQLRQDVGANYVGCRQTAIAKIYDVVKFNNRKQRAGQTLNAEEIAKAYRENVQYAKVDGGEKDNPASKTFVSEALSVHNRLLKLTRVQSVLLAADDDPTFQNPLDSVGKLYIVASKAKEPHLIEWAVAQLLDLVHSRAISVDQLGDRALAGKLQGQNGKGIVEVSVYKRDLLLHFTGSFLDAFEWPDAIKQKMREALKDVPTYRRFCGYPHEQASLAWRAGWVKSAEKYFCLVETVVYSFQRDPAVRTGMCSNKDAASCCNTGEIGAEIEEICTIIIVENPAKVKEAANKEDEDDETIATAASDFEFG